MKFARDFRKIARDSLTGRWTIAVVAGIIASMLGGGGKGLNLNVEFTDNNLDLNWELAGQEMGSLNELLQGHLPEFLSFTLPVVAGAALILGIAMFILGSIIEVGYNRFNLDLVDRYKDPNIASLFAYFRHWKTTAVAKLLQVLYVFLWGLLFIIPGIIAAYSYSMTGYLLAEYPEMTAGEAITRSKELMSGNRFRLFCLQLSFIGWDLLCLLTLGIGHLWLTPYKQAATAAFYREVSGTEHMFFHESSYSQNEYRNGGYADV